MTEDEFNAVRDYFVSLLGEITHWPVVDVSQQRRLIGGWVNNALELAELTVKNRQFAEFSELALKC